MAQNAILNRLGKLAAGRIDDWESLVDPTLSPGENYQLILERGGELPAEEKRAVEKAIAETIDDREQSRAVSILRENAAAIRAGDRPELADDIAAEYGREFVDETVTAALESIESAQETPDTFGETPEPEPEPEPEPARVESSSEPEPEPVATPEPEPEPEPAENDWGSLEPETIDDREPEPAATPEPEPAATGEVSIGREIARLARDTASELGAGARTFGAAIRFVATGA